MEQKSQTEGAGDQRRSRLFTDSFKNVFGVKEEGKIQRMNVSHRGNNAEVTAEEKSSMLRTSHFDMMAACQELRFNVDHGYLEGLVRGMKAGILTQTDYNNLAQCDTLEGKSLISFYTSFLVCFKAF